jgi:hypothetical protein
VKQYLLATKLGWELFDRYKRRRVSCYVVSYPKCGRTWLRFLLAKTLADYFNDDREIVYDPEEVVRYNRKKWPIISFVHGKHNHISRPPVAGDDSKEQYTWFSGKKIIILIRDPRDVMVSYYFQKSKREGLDSMISDFLRNPDWGIDRFNHFYKGWYTNRHVAKEFLLVRYEDISEQPLIELRKLTNFIGLSGIEDQTLLEAINFASFDNMRRLSINELKAVDRIAPVDHADKDSFKIRRGEVGAYSDYLNRDDIIYLNYKIKSDLPRYYRYRG